MESTTAKNFALQLGSLVALYVSVTTLVVMLFSIINLQFPDAADAAYQYESAQGSIRFAIAMLIVFVPTYLVLTRIVNRSRRTAKGAYLALTKWLIYLSLLVGGFVLLGDFVSVVYTFLNGEITTRFILKALTILLVVGSAFYYYLHDAKGYWNTHEKQSMQIGMGVAVIVIAAITYGYYSIDAPSVVRDISIDQNQVYDLQDMQWRVEAYYAKNETLPQTIADVYPAGIDMPAAPAERTSYNYKVTGAETYELCATFAEPTPESERLAKPIYDDPTMYQNQNWEHGIGETCFERVAQKSSTN